MRRQLRSTRGRSGALAAIARSSASLSTAATQRRAAVAAPKDLPSSAGAVVVGGGSLGAAVAYHLAKEGMQTVLLERSALTAGTTWHSAGMLWRLRPSYVDIELHGYTRDMCIQLEKETGHKSWSENGGLFIATNRERFDEYKRLHETGKAYGIESHVLTPAQVPDMHPLIAVDDVYGAIYSPTDGTIDPTGVVNAYAAAARKLGVQVFENTPVEAIETVDLGGGRSEVTGVRTGSGHTIASPVVVNACGAWANQLARTAGVRLPLLSLKHAYVVTETVPGMRPDLPNVRDHDLSIYLKTQGSAIALGGYEVNPEFAEVAPDFAFGLYDLNWDTFAQNFEGHLRRCPAVETAGIASTVCGPESFTPDHKPLVGPQPGVEGLYNANGFNSMGMMLGGGIARELARWVVRGSPSIDLFGFDCARFHPSAVADAAWVKERTHESYAKTYSIVFPHDEPLAGRGKRVSAIHDALVEQGCVHQARHGFERAGWFVNAKQGEQAPLPYDFYGAYDDGGAWRLDAARPEYAGAPWAEAAAAADGGSVAKHSVNRYNEVIEGELTFGWPASFDAVGEEVRATRTGVGIVDQSYFGKFLLTGPDADAAVQFVCGADMEGRELGRVTYTPLLNDDGGVEADLTVTRLPDGSGWYFAAGGNTATRDYEWIWRQCRKHGFDVNLADVSDDYCMISVQGPHSGALLQTLLLTTGGGGVDGDGGGGGNPFDPVTGVAFSSCARVVLAGVPVWCLRLTFVGELGYELHVPSSCARDVYAAVTKVAAAYEARVGVPVRPVGYRAIDSMSAEKGYRHWHADLGCGDTPMEAGIGFTVTPKLKRSGVGFVGREALERAAERGLQRRLVCLTVDDAAVPLHGAETIWADGACLGIVRSTAFGHTVGRTIAYGYVSKPPTVDRVTNAYLSSVAAWHVGDKAAQHAATLHLRAPFDPGNSRVRGVYDDAGESGGGAVAGR